MTTEPKVGEVWLVKTAFEEVLVIRVLEEPDSTGFWCETIDPTGDRTGRGYIPEDKFIALVPEPEVHQSDN